LKRFLRNIAYGKTGTAVSSFEEFAAIADVEAWDGKDGQLDVEEAVSSENKHSKRKFEP